MEKENKLQDVEAALADARKALALSEELRARYKAENNQALKMIDLQDKELAELRKDFRELIVHALGIQGDLADYKVREKEGQDRQDVLLSYGYLLNRFNHLFSSSARAWALYVAKGAEDNITSP